MKRSFPFVPMVVLLAVSTSANAQSWSLTGNAGTNANTNFIGTTDNKPLTFRVNNERAGFVNGTNTSLGKLTLVSNTTGVDNVAIGAFSTRYNTTGSGNAALGKAALSSNTTGGENVAMGWDALRSNTIGAYNTAIGTRAMANKSPESSSLSIAVGYEALQGSSVPSRNTGASNTALGFQALKENTTGSANVGVGTKALVLNTSGSGLCAMGSAALYSNTTGSYNTGIGAFAMEMNTVGTNNVALGREALEYNVGGSESVAVGAYAMWRADHSAHVFATENTAVGFEALMGAPQLDLNTGIRNTSVGHQSMLNNTSGGFNSAFGTEALMSNTTGTSLCALGRSALSANTTGSSNTGVGYLANVSLGTLSNATALGRGATVNANNKVRLGNASVTVVEGQAPYSWPSDARFKRDVREDVEGLDLILRLRPVSYSFDRAAFARHIKEDVGNAESPMVYAPSTRTVGFLAQEVEATVKELDYAAFDAVHVPENPTDNYSVAYAQFVVPLVKAVQELAAENKLLKDELASTNNRVDELIAAQHERESNAMKGGELKVFPVPASDLVRIQVPSHLNGRGATLELLDAQGRSMVQQAISSLGPAFDLALPSHSADGTCTVVLNVAGEQPYRARVVIAR